MDIRRFLNGFSEEELKHRGVIFGQKNLLTGQNVQPLLLREQGIRLLELSDREGGQSARSHVAIEQACQVPAKASPHAPSAPR